MMESVSGENRPPAAPGLDARLWAAGFVRIFVLIVAAAGVYTLGHADAHVLTYLLAFYALGFVSSILFLFGLRRGRSAPSPFLWAQILMDFGVVAATVSFTGGPTSFFTFLFAVVILEAGLYLGVWQGFAIATLASGVMAIQAGAPPTGDPGLSPLGLAYNFLIQCLAFYLAAAISGFWNLRLHRMQQFQREVLDNMNNGFLITNRQGVIAAQNKAADRILDMPEGAAIGRLVQDVLRTETDAECPVVTALRAQRDFTSYEFHARSASGVVKLLGLTTSRIHDARHNLTGIIASFSDLTEMAEMRQELQRQDRLAVIGELAAGLAHEIRNPVAAIRGAADEMRYSVDDQEMTARLAQIAIRESDQLDQIVGGFLDFAREPAMRREHFDARTLVEEVGESLSRRFDTVQVVVNLSGEACMISACRSELKQVILNIGNNAAEAMEGEGVLTLTAGRQQGVVEVRVEDEGPGIDPDQVSRIFEPFYTTKETGVGMGLSVCHRIVTAHDGTIRVTSRERGGSAFAIRLPAARAYEEAV